MSNFEEATKRAFLEINSFGLSVRTNPQNSIARSELNAMMRSGNLSPSGTAIATELLQKLEEPLENTTVNARYCFRTWVFIILAQEHQSREQAAKLITDALEQDHLTCFLWDTVFPLYAFGCGINPLSKSFKSCVQASVAIVRGIRHLQES